MLERWKLILSNWNNCYFSDNNKNEPALDLESLINIISHLRQNLNLDESKSSVLEAHTVKEFIEEKYPKFKFENGTVEPTNDDEIYLVGSLLLFFVCINSKDVDIKSAMCSKLSSEDQKTILKFSKCLMECLEITCSDVQTAITEACGQDIAAMEVSLRPTVAETPPALRSLHSEVRRLQAALDAERFDRNYLQEELNRTHLRVEKLVKEKKQYKLDIVNLKSKISLCGLEAESKAADGAADESAKLARQLQQIEDKLVETQAQLDDSVYERDVYKKKVEDLKRERDKFLSLSQSEAARVSQLSEELHTERRHVQSLKDLISELKQHNRLNGLDSSSLECDDPDASILSLPHNSSVCSEACANVVEVQLGEERAKIVVLKQQIQSLQDQLNELTLKTESERKTLENVISDRENNIFDLKHRINEEIEENNNLKAHYDDDMSKLNNEINELEQRLKDNSDHSRSIIEKKMQEIQTLQEEKLSLLLSLNNETTKLNNIIQGLQNDLDSEKQNKSTMRENYEAQVMKLNEKVLNRNNELVELQNSIFNKGEMIETLQIDLRKEISAKDELSKHYQELNEQKGLVENELQQKISDINELQIKIQRNNTIIEDMKSELCDLHKSISDLNDKCKILEDVREVLVVDVQTRDIRVEEALKEIEEITNKFSEENRKLKLDLDEKKATVHSLQTQLKNEIQFKVQLQNELDNLNASLQQVTVLNEQLTKELTKLKTDVQDKDKTIDGLNLHLQEEKKCNAQANKKIEKLTDNVVTKKEEIKSLKKELVRINDSLLKETQTNKENFDIEKNKLLSEIAEKESLQMEVQSFEERNVQMENMIAMKSEEIKLLQLEVDGLLEKVSEKDAHIKNVETQLSDECKKYDNIIKSLQNGLDSEKQNKFTMRENYEAQIIQLHKEVLRSNDEVVELQNSILSKGEMIETLQIQLRKEISAKDELSKQYQELNEQKGLVENELQQKISDINELQIKIQRNNTIIEDMKSELCDSHKSISDLNDKCKILEDVRGVLVTDVQNRDIRVEDALKKIEEITNKFSEENRKLKFDLDEIKVTAHSQQTQLNNEIQLKVHLQNELDNLNASLQQVTMLNEQLNIELTKLKTDVQDKDKTIDALDLHLQEEKKCNAQANEKVQKLADHVITKEKEIKSLKEELVRINDLLFKETQTNKESFDIEKNKLSCEIAEKESLQMQVKSLEEGNVQMENVIATKCEEIKLLQLEIDGLLEKVSEKDAFITYVEKQLFDECKKYDILESKFEVHMAKLNIKFWEMSDFIVQTAKTLRNKVIEKESTLQALNKKICQLKFDLDSSNNDLVNVNQKNDDLLAKLNEEILCKTMLQDKYETQCNYIESLKLQFTTEVKVLSDDFTEKSKGLNKLEMQLQNELDNLNASLRQVTVLNEQLDIELTKLKTDVQNKDKTIDAMDLYLQEEKKCNAQANEKIQKLTDHVVTKEKEIKSLKEELVRINDSLLKETQMNKENFDIEKSKLLSEIAKKESLQTKVNSLEEGNVQMENVIATKCEEIKQLQLEVDRFLEKVGEKDATIEKLEQTLKAKNELNQKLRENNEREKQTLIDECTLVQENHSKVEKRLKEKDTEITTLEKELSALKSSIESKDTLITETTKEKDEIIESLTQELSASKTIVNNLQQELTNLKEIIVQDNNAKNDLISKITNEKDATVKSLTQELLEKNTINNTLRNELINLQATIEQNNNEKDCLISEITKEKDTFIISVTQELTEEKGKLDILQQENKAKQDLISEITKEKDAIITSLTNKLTEEKNKVDVIQQELTNLQEIIEQNNKTTDAITNSLTSELAVEKTKIKTIQTKLTNLKTSLEECQQDNKAKDDLISEINKEKDAIINSLTTKLAEENTKINTIQTELTNLKSSLEQCEQDNKAKDDLISEINKEKDVIINSLTSELTEEKTKINAIQTELTNLTSSLEQCQQDNKTKEDLMCKINKEKDAVVNSLTTKLAEENTIINALQTELAYLKSSLEQYQQDYKAKDDIINSLTTELAEEKTKFNAIQTELTDLKSSLKQCQQDNKAKDDLISEINKEKDGFIEELSEEKIKIDTLQQENKAKDCIISKMSTEKDVIINSLTSELNEEKTKINAIQTELTNLKSSLELCEQDIKTKEGLISEINKEKDAFTKELSEEKIKIDTLQQENKAKDCIISKMSKEKDAIIDSLTLELLEAKIAREKSEKEANVIFNELKNNMEVRRALMKENDQLTQAVGQQETFAALCQEKAGGEKYLCLPDPREFQVSTSSDSHSSIESLKTISDLEKIIHDKNRTITTLQSDITYMKTLMAESENKLLDVNKELEITKENLQQLSNQLKKIVYQKNEEIAELRKQVNKMSVTETRATQIIKVSSKYHAMILKRIAEIKTNTVLKELTNFGNTASDNELRRSLNAGTITMEELESFLDTTDRHLKRCAEKQIGLQKERDRLYEVNRINESEIINLKKFLNELSLSFQTFSSVKNLYAQKLSRVISVQRTVRREILNLEGRVGDVAMCKLERGYAAVMQDLAECAMNLERWVERCISRTVSVEKIKQAFTSDSERSSLSSPSFQNTGLEIQLEELEKSFQKLLDEVSNVHSDSRETQATTVMEVRAQYEDKLNRMKSKMKELMSEQMAVLKDKQRAEIGLLERELQKTRDKMEEAKRGYETHIRDLTKELWKIGEKYLVKTDEAEWLKRKQHSGSLMSLQHVHSSGLVPLQELPSRPSDAHSLRSLPVTNNTNKREGRGFHMSDEEGEVFDNRFLKEITATPRRDSRPGGGGGGGGGKRLSELQFRNSLCPPHLKSSYPAETQFVPVLDEEEIKAGSLGPGAVGRAQRKEVGITAYKKPGPPTPSKQAGRLSATDSELRESLRVECDPHPADRKTSTPARIRAFLSFKSRDTNEGTPRTRRLSYNIFRKK